MTLRIAVVGAGWAGIAAAVRATARGHQVTLFDTAAQPGGRARSVEHQGLWLDNGQHIFIGAYRDTLRLMRQVGVRPDDVLLRKPLRLLYPDGNGLVLPPGPPMRSFVRGVWSRRGWPLGERLSVLRAAAGWMVRGFDCPAEWTVERLTSELPMPVRAELIEPLCVAALNTPASCASARVFLRVLHDALFSGPGCADLLLPRRPLQELLPEPAMRWLRSRGADVALRHRVQSLEREDCRWRVDGRRFDAVVLACTSVEAARLTQPHAPHWARGAAAFRHEPIVTVVLQSAAARLSEPILALPDRPGEPAQFVFDQGQLGGLAGRLAFVISGAGDWVRRGLQICAHATVDQAVRALGPQCRDAEVVACWAEKRATFLCTPALHRPAQHVAPGLLAAADYVDGPYPSTLEGAVRSGLAAADALA